MNIRALHAAGFSIPAEERKRLRNDSDLLPSTIKSTPQEESEGFTISDKCCEPLCDSGEDNYFKLHVEQ